MRKQWLVLAASLLVMTAVPAFAQRITATIRGTVLDPQGAVVAGAKVTVKNEDTGLTRTSSSNKDGNYSFAELPVGSYRIDVEQAGFKAASRSKIVVNVADVRAVDIMLQTGDISEQVNVEVAAVAVKTVGAEIAGVMTGEQVRELPLNGRNFVQLTLLQPGVTAQQGLNTVDKGLGGAADVSVSGGSTTANLWLVDGANNNDVGSNRTILVYPSVDAIEEFKIQRNNYGAEFGQAGGAQVNLVTRSGTNEFHGSGYYYARRDSWNSPDYFLEQAGQPAAPLHWDDYGGTFGGPVLKDKLHFFLSYEKNKNDSARVSNSFVPTQAERNGDFSGPGVPGCSDPKPIDPLTGQPFPGNIIPANRIDPGGKAMMQLMSLPNVTPSAGSCNNWVTAVSAPVNWDQINGRMDWTITNTTRLMVRYTKDSWSAINGSSPTTMWGDDSFPVVTSNWDQPAKILVAQLNKNIGSSMVNSLSFSYSANTITVTRGGDSPELVQTLTSAIPTTYPADIKAEGGQGQPMANWGSLGPYGGGVLWNQAPWTNNEALYNLKDDYSAVFGKHFVKAGFLWSYNEKNEEPANTSQESVQVNGTAGILGPNGYISGVNTGNTIGNWLLSGMVWNTSEIRANVPVQQRWKDFEFYVADSYKVSPRFTVDYGARMSHLMPTYDAQDRTGSFDPSTANPALGNSSCNGMTYPPGTNPCPALGVPGGSDGVNRSLTPIKFLFFAPRLGLAWDVHGNGKTAVRVGGGLFYQRERVSPGLGLGGNPPFAGVANVTRTLAAATPVVGGASAAYGSPGAGLAQDDSNSHNWQYNAAFEHEIVRNTVLEVAYVGSRGADLLGNTNMNEVLPQNRLAFAQTGNAALRPLNNVAGLGAGSNPILWTHNRYSTYNALQAALRGRFGSGSQYSLAYTWSKSIGNTGLSNADSGLSVRNTYTDSTQPDLDKARGNNDRRHIFNASLVWALPTFDDKSGFQKHVLGNWEFTSIVQAGSGYPITVFVSNPTGLDGNAGITGTGYTGNQRPNVVEDQPCHIDSDNKAAWLNPAKFTIDGFQIGTNGNAGRNICDGPSFFQWDAALYKNIKLGKRVQLQFRAELFNVLNTTNLLGLFGGNQETQWVPNNTVYDTGNGATATRVVSSTPAGGFGQLSQAAMARLLQLGIRLRF